VGHVATQTILLRDGQRLHQLPAGEIRATDVADFARPHHVVERIQDFFYGSQRIECVQLIEVDVVGAESSETSFDSTNEMVAGRAHIVGSWSGAEGAFG